MSPSGGTATELPPSTPDGPPTRSAVQPSSRGGRHRAALPRVDDLVGCGRHAEHQLHRVEGHLVDLGARAARQVSPEDDVVALEVCVPAGRVHADVHRDAGHEQGHDSKAYNHYTYHGVTE